MIVVAIVAPQHPPSPSPQITLVDANERFVFKPLLYELLSGAAGEEEVAPTFEKILRPTSVSFVRGQVESVNDGPATGPEVCWCWDEW